MINQKHRKPSLLHRIKLAICIFFYRKWLKFCNWVQPNWFKKLKRLFKRKKMSHYQQGKFKPKNPRKYVGDPTNIVYRSGWELKILKWLDNEPSILSYSSEEIIVPYISPVDKQWHRYFPDFVVKTRTKDGKLKTLMIEVKPASQSVPPKQQKRVTKRYITEVTTWGVNRAKWKAAIEFCKDRNWEFVVMVSKDGSKFETLTEHQLYLD